MFQGFSVPKPYNIENHIKTLVSRLFPFRSQPTLLINFAVGNTRSLTRINKNSM